MLINVLIASGWTASNACSLRTSCANSLVAFYLLLLCYQNVKRKHGSQWSRHFIPQTTLKNLCFVAAHAVLACLHWPADLPWRPGSRVETCAEYYFAALKKCFHGNPSIKDSVLAAHMTHLRQYRDATRMWAKATKGRAAQALRAEEAADLSNSCLRQACDFMAWITVDQDWETLSPCAQSASVWLSRADGF